MRRALVVGLLVVSACGSTKTNQPDTGRDADASSAVDSASADLMKDRPTTETLADRAADAAAETPIDVPPEVRVDAVVETHADAAPEAPPFDADPSTPLGACELIERENAAYLSRCLGYSSAVLGPVYTTFLCPDIAASVAAGLTAFDASAVSACITAIDGSSCPIGLTTTSYPACAAYKPLLQPGAACAADRAECSGNAYCAPMPGTCGGVCTTFLAANATCALTGPECGAGLECQNGECKPSPTGASANQTCVVAPDYVFCAAGLYCASDSNTCQPQKTSGPCPLGIECALPSWCVGPASSQQCAPLKKLDATCTQGQHECEIGTWCGAGGVCVGDPIVVGGSCAPVVGEQVECALGAYCDDSTMRCLAFGKPGDPCSDDRSCGGENDLGVCDSTGHCVACAP